MPNFTCQCGEIYGSDQELESCYIEHSTDISENDLEFSLHDLLCRATVHIQEDDNSVTELESPWMGMECCYLLEHYEHSHNTGPDQEKWEKIAEFVRRFSQQHIIPLPILLAFIDRLGDLINANECEYCKPK